MSKIESSSIRIELKEEEVTPVFKKRIIYGSGLDNGGLDISDSDLNTLNRRACMEGTITINIFNVSIENLNEIELRRVVTHLDGYGDFYNLRKMHEDEYKKEIKGDGLTISMKISSQEIFDITKTKGDSKLVVGINIDNYETIILEINKNDQSIEFIKK